MNVTNSKLTAYQNYKETGLPWVGRCPAHWSLRRMKYLVDERVEKGYPDEPLLTASQSRGVIPKADYGSRTVEALKDLHLLKLVEPGDYVISLRSFQGGIEFAHVRGIISPAYTVLKPKSDVRRGYYEHFFKSSAFISSMTLFVTGIREGQNIDYVRLSRAYMPVPPPDEQDAIGRFIRHLDQRVNRLIKTKRRLIELLNEQKQAIIHRAVTRGLDPTVPLKHSGIDWLREIPAHWTLRRLRHLVSERLSYGANEAAELTDETLPRYIRITDFSQDGSLRSETFRSLPREKAQDYMVYPGDILLARSGATVGKAFLVPEGTGEACHAGYLIKAMVRRDLMHPEYLFAFTQSRAYFDWKEATFNIATIQNIGADKYANLHVPTPGLWEQSEILAAIEQDSKPINEAVSKLRSEIDFIREYRTRLVADVVTGQLDVRHLDLPEVGESLIEAIDADTDYGDDSEEGEDGEV